ncbi:MAG: hypothetical protein LRY71_11285 [Bacillaceae bacterium]|nr:hypothetical protein [Bacillaceae bacterium]
MDKVPATPLRPSDMNIGSPIQQKLAKKAVITDVIAVSFVFNFFLSFLHN